MKINANKGVTLLDGKTPLKQNDVDLTIGVAIATALVNSDGEPIKTYELAKKFNDGGTIEVDTADLKLVKAAVTKYPNYNALVKGQVLVMLEGVK